MSNCLECGTINPPSMGVKPRKYCSRKCANSYLHELERQKHPRYGDPTWKKKTTLQLEQNKIDKQKRRAEYEWCYKHMYSARRIEEEFGMPRVSIRAKALAFDIEGKLVYWPVKTRFFTYEESQRILKEVVSQHDNAYLRKTRAAARIRSKQRRRDPKVKAREAKNKREKRQNDPAYRLRCCVHALVMEPLIKRQGRTKGGKIFALLSYTPKDLREHLEKKFTEGMTWENHGEWHLDHITPQSALPYTDLEHPNFKKAWALENLQPLWAKENCSKGSVQNKKI